MLKMEEDKKLQEALDKAKKLENMEFSEETEFDHNEYYDAIGKIANANNENNIKNNEADIVLEQYAAKYLDDETIKVLDNKKEAILNLLRKYNPSGDLVQNMEIYDVDRVYAISNYLVNAYINHMNEINFKIVLSFEEIKFLNKILTKSIEYNGDDVFNFVKLYEDFWKVAMEKFEEDKSKKSYTFKTNIQMILILHHLIKEYKVKGSGNDFMHFRSILYQIAETNKLFNAFNIVIERLKEECKLWGSALDKALEHKDPEYIKAKKLEQEKKEKEGQIELLDVTDKD